MRILVVSQYFWPETFRVNDLCEELVNRGHDVTVLTGLPNYPDGVVFPEYISAPEKYSSLGKMKIVRVPLVPRGTGSLRLLLNYLSFVMSGVVIGAWKLRGQKFDIVFVNQLSPVTSALPGLFIAKIRKIPVAMWILDLWPDTLHAIGVVRSPRGLRVVETLVSFIYRRCSLILGQSKSFIPKVKQLAPPDTLVDYLPSWAESLFSTKSSRGAPEVSDPQKYFNVMFAGNIGEAQDFPCILDAAEYLKSESNIRWLIVGDGRKASWVKDEIVRRGLESRVVLLGRFPMERMPEFFACADILLVTLAKQPIFSMTIPGKLQSYLAAGIPVVGALDGEGAAVIREANAGLVAPSGDAKRLAEVVLQMAKMPKVDLLRLGDNGQKYSNKHFDRASVISKLEDFLHKTVC